MRFGILITIVGTALLPVSGHGAEGEGGSPRMQITVENWDKGGMLSRWAYTHVSEVFPTAVIRRGGAILELPEQPRSDIAELRLTGDKGSQSFEEFIHNGAVDGCIIVHQGHIVYERYPAIRPNDLHITMSVTKAVVAATLAILEERGRIDLEKPVDAFMPELKRSGWGGVRLRDIVDMRSGIEGSENSGDPYRDPAHKQYQLEATLGLQPRTADKLPGPAREGNLIEFLGLLKRENKPGERWAYTSSNTAIIGEIISRVTGRSLADSISELIWSHIGADHDALMIQNERGFPVAHCGMAATLRDVARFGLLFTKKYESRSAQPAIISDKILKRMVSVRGGADEKGSLPLTYQWDLLNDKGEMAKGGWAGQLLYINRDKDLVIGYSGTNLTADPKPEPLPCKVIAEKLF